MNIYEKRQPMTVVLLSEYIALDIAWIVVSMLTPLDVNLKNHEQQFQEYCELGYFEMAQQILDLNRIGVGGGLSVVCQLGYTDLARIIVQKMNARMNIGINGAIQNDHKEIVRTIQNYSNDYKTNGFFQACVHGHFSIVKMFVENGVTELQKGIQMAGINQHSEIQSYLFQCMKDKMKILEDNYSGLMEIM